MTTPPGGPTPEWSAARISDLEDAQTIDRDLIFQLTAEGVIDRKLIEGLQAQGAVDRDLVGNLQVALGTARRIGAAIGILMISYKITEEAAFELLRIASQRNHRKLRDVAERVILTGTLPA